MKRIQSCEDIGLVDGNPRLARIVLDRMAGDDTVATVRESLRRELREEFPSPRDHELAKRFARISLCPQTRVWHEDAEIGEWQRSKRLPRLLGQPAVWLVLAADSIAADLAAGIECPILEEKLSGQFVGLIGVEVRGKPDIIRSVKLAAAAPHGKYQAMSASILHAASVPWRPYEGVPASLAAAHLSGINWQCVDLVKSNLNGANFQQAILSSANLGDSKAEHADFRDAKLDDAILNGITALAADFRGADLTDVTANNSSFCRANFETANLCGGNFNAANFQLANLRRANCAGARFSMSDLSAVDARGAELINVNFIGANLRGVDLSACRIDKCDFSNADLSGANLKTLKLDSGNFSKTQLKFAVLIGCSLRYANLEGAQLVQAELADVCMVGANLRGAEMENAMFHLDTTRSDVMDCPNASEESKIGVYTDGDYKRKRSDPSRFRKADLRGADLTGASVHRCNFYLVDLRCAIFDDGQKQHFRRCGAIL